MVSMIPWSSTPPLGALPTEKTTLSHSSTCRFAMPAGSSAIITPSAMPLTPRPPYPALLLPELSVRASGLSTTPPLRHPLLQPTLACLAWVGWRSGGGESPPPAWPSRPSPASAPTAFGSDAPLPPQHTSLLARPCFWMGLFILFTYPEGSAIRPHCIFTDSGTYSIGSGSFF